MSKSLWAKTFSVHEGIQELKKELLLDRSRFGKEEVIAQLQTSSKTQTSWTSQTQGNPFGNKESVGLLGKYVAWKLRRALSLERHIMNSVEEFHARIEELELDQDDRLITADVKDFFVVGDHWYLARMAASILEPKDRNLLEKVVLFFTPKPVRDQHTQRIRWSFPGGTRFGHRICCKW